MFVENMSVRTYIITGEVLIHKLQGGFNVEGFPEGDEVLQSHHEGGRKQGRVSSYLGYFNLVGSSVGTHRYSGHVVDGDGGGESEERPKAVQ